VATGDIITTNRSEDNPFIHRRFLGRRGGGRGPQPTFADLAYQELTKK
jgi:hypothetical protein